MKPLAQHAEQNEVVQPPGMIGTELLKALPVGAACLAQKTLRGFD
jgi:hypothetical protein